MKVIQCTVFVIGFASVAAQKYKVNPNIPEAKLANTGFKHYDGGKNLKLCESDCDKDTDCAKGLWCADGHKAELAKVGLDERAANCYNSNKYLFSKTDVFEVCCDPKILSSGGAGGGTLIHGTSLSFPY